jgi:integrase
VPDFLQPCLTKLAKDRPATDQLFVGHWRDWPRRWVQKICKAGGVPEVSAHAMRGLHGTLAVDSGITAHAVAAALGHESFKTTAESYAKRDAVSSAQQKRVLGVLTGGKIAS